MDRHAYLIAAHGNFAMLKKLLHALDNERNDLYLHVDKKAKAFDPHEFSAIVKHAKLIFLKRMSVTWGGYSQIALELMMLNRATETHHSYYHYISGVDIPLKTQTEILAFFDEREGREFVEIDEEGVASNNYATRHQLYYFAQEIVGRRRKFPFNCLFTMQQKLLGLQKRLGTNRAARDTIPMSKGACWFSITHEFAKHLLSYEPWIKKRFRHTFCCDEVFMQTVFMQSPFRERIHPYMRLIDWERGTPYTYRIGDVEELTQSDMLFARKFDYALDSEIVDLLYDRLEQREQKTE